MGQILYAGEVALEDIAVEELGLSLGMVRVQIGPADFDKVADLHLQPPADQTGVVGLFGCPRAPPGLVLDAVEPR